MDSITNGNKFKAEARESGVQLNHRSSVSSQGYCSSLNRHSAEKWLQHLTPVSVTVCVCSLVHVHGHVLVVGPGRGWVSSSIVSSMAVCLILLRQGTLLDLKLAVSAMLPRSSCLHPLTPS